MQVLPHWLGFALAMWTGVYTALAAVCLDRRSLLRAYELRLGAALALVPSLPSAVQPSLPDGAAEVVMRRS